MSSNVLKCVVQFSYIRYNINQVPGGESYQEDTDQFNEPELKWTKSLDLFGNYDDDLISEYGNHIKKKSTMMLK